MLALRRRGPGALRITRRELAGCAFVGFALLLGGNGLVAVAEDDGMPSGLAALVVASVPLWVVLFRAADRRPRVARDGAWVALGFAGVALLLLPGERPDGATIGGMLILVAAAFCWASGLVRVRPAGAPGATRSLDGVADAHRRRDDDRSSGSPPARRGEVDVVVVLDRVGARRSPTSS